MVIHVGNVIGGCVSGGLPSISMGVGVFDGSADVNPNVAYNVDNNLNNLSSLTFRACGGLNGVENRNVLFSATDPFYDPEYSVDGPTFPMAAVWGEDVVSGCGRLSTVADFNWLDPEYREPLTAAQVIQNIGKFLYGTLGNILVYTADSESQVTLSFTAFNLESIGLSTTTVYSPTLPDLNQYDGIWFNSLYTVYSEEEKDRIAEFVEFGKGAYLGTEWNGCCSSSNASTLSIINRLIGSQ